MKCLRGKPQTMKCTLALARRFAEMEPAPHDRALSERRIKVYTAIAARDEFRPLTWAEAVCRETGITYRVNGKHTSTTIHRMGTVPPSLYVTVETYDCNNLEDVARLYATFDNPICSRTTADINRSFAATIPELANINAKILNACVHGMAYYVDQDRYCEHQPAERAEAMLECPDFVCWCDRVIGYSKDSRHLVRGPVIGAVFASYRKAKGDAESFWRAVRDESGPTPKLADRVLAKYLRSITINCGQGATETKLRSAREAPRKVFVKCLTGWNAWRKGETTDLKYYPNAKIPTVR